MYDKKSQDRNERRIEIERDLRISDGEENEKKKVSDIIYGGLSLGLGRESHARDVFPSLIILYISSFLIGEMDEHRCANW